MADDEYVEGNSESAPADAPGAVPTDDAGGKKDSNQFGIDSSSVHDAPLQRLPRKTERTREARKAFAEAVIASKKETAAKPPVEAGGADEFDPEAPAAAKPPALAATADAAAAKAAGAETPPAPAITAAPAAPAAVASTAPPAPSLDPEVRKLTAYLNAQREKLDAERAEFEKSKKPVEIVAPDTHSLEAYIDSPPSAYRNWLESMRGEKFATDDEFKSEVSDFITMLSSDVLGVPLPESVRVKLDAAQAKKIVRTHKTIQTRKDAIAAAKLEQERATTAEKAEIERVEHEWTKAAGVLSQQFAAAADAEGKPATSAAAKAYPWLAAEDDPGKIIVDVIRAAVGKDGTQLSWQEASQRANDYLADQAKRYYDKRKPLLSSEPAKPAAPAAAAPKPAAPPAPAAPVARPAAVPPAPNKWSRDKHVEATKAAFRQMIAAKTE